jgi:heme-degrading monooxygenase HmoA
LSAPVARRHQRYRAAPGIAQIEGAPPKRRVVIVKWDSLEQLQAWRNSEQYMEDRKIGYKYAKIRAFAVEDLPTN